MIVLDLHFERDNSIVAKKIYPLKKIYILSIFIVSIIFNAPAQTVNIGGQCMSGSITLPYLQDVAGKNAYVGSGTVMGISDVSIAVYWIGAPDNVWVIAFEGQPYFFSTCNTDIPPGTANPSCSWTAVGGTSCTGAQPLSVTGNVVLPVGLTDFSATAHDQKSILEWHTAQEQNNRGFYVERSPDGTNWTVIGFVAGAGNSNTPKAYSFTDVAPAKGNNFYRLRQEDIDNRQKFSAIAKVSFSNATDIIVTNNP